MNLTDELEEFEIPRRPTLLKVLCILTFIGSGLSILSAIFSYNFAGKEMAIFQNEKLDSISTKHQTVPLNKEDSILLKDSLQIPDSLLQSNAAEKSQLDTKVMKTLGKMMDSDLIKKKAIADLIGAIFTLSGALIMWRMKRIGFYLYILGTLISTLSPLNIYGNDLLIVGSVVVSGIIGMVFITLYALNWKSLR